MKRKDSRNSEAGVDGGRWVYRCARHTIRGCCFRAHLQRHQGSERQQGRCHYRESAVDCARNTGELLRELDQGVRVHGPVAIATPPTGDGLVVTSVDISAYSVTTPGSSYLNISPLDRVAALARLLGTFQHGVYPSSIG